MSDEMEYDEDGPTQETQEKLDALAEKWPDANWGPAHIVVADGNVGDGHIRWCLGLCKAAISHDPKDLYRPGEDTEFIEKMEWYQDQTIGCLHATIAVLEELLKVPENER